LALLHELDERLEELLLPARILLGGTEALRRLQLLRVGAVLRSVVRILQRTLVARSLGAGRAAGVVGERDATHLSLEQRELGRQAFYDSLLIEYYLLCVRRHVPLGTNEVGVVSGRRMVANRLGVVLRASFEIEFLFHLIRLHTAEHRPLHRAQEVASVLEVVETAHLRSHTRIIVLVSTLGSWRVLLVRCVALGAVLLSLECFSAH